WSSDVCSSDLARYADFGSNCETYVKGSFVELESLGPLQRLEPGAATEYVEHWHLFPDVEIGGSEATLDAAPQPLFPPTVPRQPHVGRVSPPRHASPTFLV